MICLYERHITKNFHSQITTDDLIIGLINMNNSISIRQRETSFLKQIVTVKLASTGSIICVEIY